MMGVLERVEGTIMGVPERVEGGGSRGGSVLGSLIRWIFGPVRTNTGVPVFEGGLGGEGERMAGCGGIGKEAGAEDSKSPKSSNESLEDWLWLWFGVIAGGPATKSANRSGSARGASPETGGGGKAGIGGESKDGTSARNAC
jgi:hypothetical protein